MPEGPSTKTSITGNRLAYVQYVYVHPAGYGTTLSAVVDTVAGKSVAVFFFLLARGWFAPLGSALRCDVSPHLLARAACRRPRRPRRCCCYSVIDASSVRCLQRLVLLAHSVGRLSAAVPNTPSAFFMPRFVCDFGCPERLVVRPSVGGLLSVWCVCLKCLAPTEGH